MKKLLQPPIEMISCSLSILAATLLLYACHSYLKSSSQFERIVYCHRAISRILTGQSYVELGHLEDGIWISVDDETLLAIKDRYPGLPLLYFSRADYEHAMRKLAPLEVNNAIHRRLERWSPTALDQVLDWLYRGERRSLTLAALGRMSGSSDVAAVIDEHFEQTLRLLAKISGEWRYDDVRLSEMFIAAVEGEAKLHDENLLASKAAQSANNLTEAQRFSQATNSRKKYAQILGRALEQMGSAEYVNSLPYVDLERGLFISPRDPDLIGGLRVEYRPFAEWRDGLVAIWPIRKIPDLERRGKSVAVLYLNSGEFLEDLYELTDAQLEREFEERLQGARGASLQAMCEYLNTLHLEQILLKLNLLEIVRRKAQTLVPLLEAQVVEETVTLRSALVLHPSWLAQGLEPGEDAIIRLKRNEQELAQDAALFVELCGRAKKDTLQSLIAAILEVKQQDIARLARL